MHLNNAIIVIFFFFFKARYTNLLRLDKNKTHSKTRNYISVFGESWKEVLSP